MLYRVTHRTRYDYDESVGQCHNVAFMMPRATPCARPACRRDVNLSWSPQPWALTELARLFRTGPVTRHRGPAPQPGGHGAHSLVMCAKTGSRRLAADFGNTAPGAGHARRRTEQRYAAGARIRAAVRCRDRTGHTDYAATFFAGRPAVPLRREGFDAVRLPRIPLRTPVPATSARRFARFWRTAAGYDQDFAHLAIACAALGRLRGALRVGDLRPMRHPGRQRKLVVPEPRTTVFAVLARTRAGFEFDTGPRPCRRPPAHRHRAAGAN